MKTRFENLILLLFTAAFAWMFYAGIQGVAGVALAIAVLAFAIVCMFVERAAAVPSHVIRRHTPLLFDAVLLLGGTYMVLTEGGRLGGFYALLALGCLACIIYWLVDRRYEGRSVKTILAEELHILPPASEIALVVFFLLEIVLKRESPSGVMQISIVIFSIDAAAQMLLKRTACSKQ